jgi:hypothetical protein
VINSEVTRVVDGVEMGKEVIKTMHLSDHSQAAIQNAMIELCCITINDLMTKKASDLIKDYAIPVGYCAAHTFGTSVLNEKLLAITGNEAFSKNFSSSGVTIVAAYIYGSEVNVEKVLVNSAISTILGVVSNTSILCFKDFIVSSQGGLFSSRNQIEFGRGKSVEVPLWQGVSVGAHSYNGYVICTLNDGRKQQDKYLQKGVHVGIVGNIASASLGLRNGKSTIDPILSKNVDGSTSSHYSQESYSGKFVLSIQIGDKRRNIQLLPTFQSHKIDSYERFFEDGSPLKSTRTVNNSQIFSFDHTTYQDASVDHVTLLENLIHDFLDAAGTQEHVTKSTTHHHKKRRWFFFKKKWNQRCCGRKLGHST